MLRIGVIFTLTCLATTGCAIVDPSADFDRLGDRMRAVTGVRDVFDPQDEEAVTVHIKQLVADGISADDAVAICLLNNPQIQAMFFQIGAARADVVQSQLLSNPSLGVTVRFPDGGGLANIEAGIAQNILDLWQIPVRKRIAERALNQTILQVAHKASQLAADTRAAYYECVAARQLVEITEENKAASQQLVSLSESFRDAGAGSGVDVNLTIAARQRVELELRAAKLRVYETETELAQLLGWEQWQSHLELTDALLDPPAANLAVVSLLEAARAHRADLAAARHHLRALADKLDLEIDSVFKIVQIGIELEREARPDSDDGSFLGKTARSSLQSGALTPPPVFGERDEEADVTVGPSLSVELPVFDQNQAQIAKAEFRYQEAAKRMEALLADVVREVYLAHRRAATAWDIVRYYDRAVLPLQERNIDLAEEAYRTGKAALLSVLDAQRTAQSARAGYVQARLAGTMAWIDMQRATARSMAQLLDQGKEETDQPNVDDTSSDP